MPPTIEVCSIKLPGREDRLHEAPCTQLPVLVERIVAAMQPYLTIPFALFGHSLGGLLAFEVARTLGITGDHRPKHLFVSARQAPQLARHGSPIHGLPDDALIGALLQRYGGIPDAILREPDLLRIYLPIIRSDLTLLETYTYRDGAALTCPISVFGGIDDRAVGRAELAAWHSLTNGPFDLTMFPGDHFFIRSARGLVLQRLTKSLAGSMAC